MNVGTTTTNVEAIRPMYLPISMANFAPIRTAARRLPSPLAPFPSLAFVSPTPKAFISIRYFCFCRCSALNSSVFRSFIGMDAIAEKHNNMNSNNTNWKLFFLVESVSGPRAWERKHLLLQLVRICGDAQRQHTLLSSHTTVLSINEWMDEWIGSRARFLVFFGRCQTQSGNQHRIQITIYTKRRFPASFAMAFSPYGIPFFVLFLLVLMAFSVHEQEHGTPVPRSQRATHNIYSRMSTTQHSFSLSLSHAIREALANVCFI